MRQRRNGRFLALMSLETFLVHFSAQHSFRIKQKTIKPSAVIAAISAQIK